jgi:hypothetical protein
MNTAAAVRADAYALAIAGAHATARAIAVASANVFNPRHRHRRPAGARYCRGGVVRFWGNSGHRNLTASCPLVTQSRHWQPVTLERRHLLLAGRSHQSNRILAVSICEA